MKSLYHIVFAGLILIAPVLFGEGEIPIAPGYTSAPTKVTSKNLPWAAIGRLTYGTDKVCTGTLVSPDLIVTNASCVQDSKGNPRDLVFSPSSGHPISSSVVSSWSGNRDNGDDWAIARLASPLGSAVGYLGVRYVTIEDMTSLEWREKLSTAGYSKDYGQGQVASGSMGCSALKDESDDDMGFSHDCVTKGESRGAPLLALFPDAEGKPNNVQIVGLHHFTDSAETRYAVHAKSFLLKLKKLIANKEGKLEQSYVNLCNRTSTTRDEKQRLRMAYAYKEAGRWVSVGWFIADPGTCRELPIPVKDYSNSVYVFAEGARFTHFGPYGEMLEEFGEGKKWEGDGSNQFCVSQKDFTIAHHPKIHCTHEDFLELPATADGLRVFNFTD